MTPRRISDLRTLEGRQVGVSLADGSRIDDATLVSARPSPGTVWLFAAGTDVFVRASAVVDAWEWRTGARRAA
ncbi:MAG TPA: hypothetical protein VM242_03580 [Acidimicrobiales bacterium]|jgi:hypothetical protein|nr:hypothetical protein [Acidimicrobiales bacterium]